MRVIAVLLTVFALLSCQKSSAQTQPRLAPAAQPQGPQRPVQPFYVEDGGTREVLESIVIPPKAQAPFSLLLQTEWVKTLSDGGTITLVNQRRIARDREGRIYQERWFLVPKNGKDESRMTAIQIADPNNHTLYNCLMLNHRDQCLLSTYTPSTNAIYEFQGPPTGLLPDSTGSAIHEDLGKQLIAGLETIGTRDSIIYNPGVFGNDRTMTVEREFWYSTQLGINLLSKRSDPRFKLPDGFQVVDQRQTAPPEN